MSLQFGLRAADITRRETAIISWLNFRDTMTERELTTLFGEWVGAPYEGVTNKLTRVALGNLVSRNVITPHAYTETGDGQGQTFRLPGSALARFDPETVELAPREMSLLSFMSTMPLETQIASKFDSRFGSREPDSMRTLACLGHLSNLGLIQAVDQRPGIYEFPLRG